MRISFERIGRNHNVEDLVIPGVEPTEHNADAIAEAVYLHARPHLMSRDVEVVVDVEGLTANIYAGFHAAGRGTITEDEPDAER